MTTTEIRARLHGITESPADEHPIVRAILDDFADGLTPLIDVLAQHLSTSPLTVVSRRSRTPEEAAARVEQAERELAELNRRVARGQLVRKIDLLVEYEQRIGRAVGRLRTRLRQLQRDGAFGPPEGAA